MISTKKIIRKIPNKHSIIGSKGMAFDAVVCVTKAPQNVCYTLRNLRLLSILSLTNS